ncbi:bifunctional YncE family protein/alkaline phosphatase family protein [Actinopolymorpha pittospori]|uniref:YVTN family beta-propeller protein n=1 Tax=Actinopolymorpha pittospori TaxID=648752 RepID=A0A927MN99_9ACTN|nr:bifunctional YncE family protein/alkaline phosphatase family protein [Actinopolymorpha pittospori]MBE1603831.1 YVTN family beta-propeller protein [Actinopolymorpha pittospori]
MQVVRQRREKARTGLLTLRKGRAPIVTAATVALISTSTGIALAQTTQFGFEQAGQTTDQGRVLANGQHADPIGETVVLNEGKFMSTTVSPDGTHLAGSITDGAMAMAIADLKDFKLQEYVGNNPAADLKIAGNDVGQEGPTYSPDGKQLWLGQANGYTRFTVNTDGSVSNPTTVSIPAQGGKQALVGAAVFSADAKTVYAAVNGQNRVVAIDAATGTVTHSWTVGTAPRGMVLVGNKLYVSNEGGRPAKPGEATQNSYGTQVPADPNAGTTTGTLSVINTADSAAAPASIDVGLHPTAVYAKDGTVFVTNTNSNTVSVIDTTTDMVVQTIATQPWPEASVGYDPNAVTLTDDGHLLVTLGRANAVAVYKFTSAREPVAYVGLLPTDYYPSEITTVGDEVLVSNTRGIDARSPSNYPPPAWYHGTHDTTTSVERFALPSDGKIRSETEKVFKLNGWTPNSVQFSSSNGRGVKPVAVPKKIGDPSTIKHVFLVVKENRTYDQVFSDMPYGDNDPRLLTYGENVTPNQHALASQFGLYDNFYDPATNSAEGHSWLMQGDNPEYTESSAGEYTRSYDSYNDALGHQASGFIWTGAQAAGKTARDFGEYQMQSNSKPSGATWQNLYCDTLNMAANPAATTAYPMNSAVAIPSLNDISVHGFPGGDLSIPDLYRYEIWKRDFEANGPANLNMFWFPNDHTGGTTTAPAQVADNDLALGKLVDTISHSKYWKDSAIFVVEDDSQAWVDHVDGHRAPVQIISPWSRRTGVVDSHYYTQATMIRTIEQILGIHPMNQMDSAATPMAGAFTNKPDFTPFDVVPNRTSLTLGVENNPPSCGLDTPAPQDTKAAPAPTTGQAPAAQQKVAAAWNTWKAKQHFTGDNARVDSAPPELMARMSWYESTGWTKPYHGDAKILTPDQVPGAAIPGLDTDG